MPLKVKADVDLDRMSVTNGLLLLFLDIGSLCWFSYPNIASILRCRILQTNYGWLLPKNMPCPNQLEAIFVSDLNTAIMGHKWLDVCTIAGRNWTDAVTSYTSHSNESKLYACHLLSSLLWIWFVRDYGHAKSTLIMKAFPNNHWW